MPVELSPAVIEEVCVLGGNAARFERFESDARRCGWCAEPIRMKGVEVTASTSTGEITSRSRPYLKACGTRRATRCPSCADRYRHDAKQIVLAGLEGGKGIAASVAEHPAVFAALTAPSFGAVHRARRPGAAALPCHSSADRSCIHGRALACNEIHDERDHRVGEPLCVDCYDYERAVLWNALCPELWRHTTIYCRRPLARHLGVSEKALRALCRLSFVKVAEYQRHGVLSTSTSSPASIPSMARSSRGPRHRRPHGCADDRCPTSRRRVARPCRPRPLRCTARCAPPPLWC